MSLRTILAQEGLGRIEEVWDVLYDQLRKMLRRAGYSITDLGGHKNTAIKISGHPTVTTIKFDLDRPDNRGFRVWGMNRRHIRILTTIVVSLYVLHLLL